MLRKGKRARRDHESGTAAVSDGVTDDHEDSPAPAFAPVRPDETVLDELSRVFGAAGDSPSADDTAPSEPDPLAAATAVPDDPSGSTPSGA